MRQSWLSAILVCLLAGCVTASSPSADVASGAGPTACCSSLADVNFSRLDYPSETRFALSDTSPTFNFPGLGVSRLAAFELPALEHPYRLQLRAYMGFLKNFLYPVVTFLDQERRVIGFTDPLRLTYGRPGWVEPGGLDLEVVITPEDHARYAIVHTMPELVSLGPAGAVSIARMIADGKGGFAVQGRVHPYSGRGEPTGDLKLTLGPPQEPKPQKSELEERPSAESQKFFLHPWPSTLRNSAPSFQTISFAD